MIKKVAKDEIRSRIHRRIRRKVRGLPERPRLAVYRSGSHIYAQVIDDTKGHTVVCASSVEKNSRMYGGNIGAAREIGKRIAQRAREQGIQKVVFDRGGYLYHGRVKALAEAAREAGLEL